MGKNILIVPGFAKAGTTFFFDQIARNNLPEINVPTNKETNYFVHKDHLSEFNNCYSESLDPDSWFLDVSPKYLNIGFSPILNMINATRSANVKIIVFLRDPPSQIYSHYLHALKSSIAQLHLRKFRANFRLTSRALLKKFFRPRHELIKTMIDAFGATNVLGMGMKTLFSDKASRVISDFIGVDLGTFNTRDASNQGGWMPYYIFSKNEHASYYQDGCIYKIPKGRVVLVNGDHSRIYRNFLGYGSDVVLSESAQWTQEFACEGKMLDMIMSDFRRICDLLSVDEYDCMSDSGHRLAAKPARLDDRTLSKLTVAYRLEEAATKAFQKNASALIRQLEKHENPTLSRSGAGTETVDSPLSPSPV